MSDASSLARTLRILWLAICASGGLAMAVFGYLATTSEPTMPEAAEVGFYGVALLSMVATGIAFILIRAMERRLLQTETESEAGGIIRTFGIGALGTAEMPAIASGVAAFLTGVVCHIFIGTQRGVGVHPRCRFGQVGDLLHRTQQGIRPLAQTAFQLGNSIGVLQHSLTCCVPLIQRGVQAAQIPDPAWIDRLALAGLQRTCVRRCTGCRRRVAGTGR